MKSRMNPFALAACALLAAAPFAAQAAPSVTFKKPDGGYTVSQTIQGTGCEVTGTGIARVVFSLVPSSGGSAIALQTDTSSPWNCIVDPSRYPSGAYILRAVAYDSAGATDSDTRSIRIENSGTTSSTTNTPPSVSITAPASGATVSGTVNCGANASDSNGVSRVVFSLDGAVIATDTSSPYTCSFNASTLAAGSHTLRAQATDSLGATSSTQISFNVSGSSTSNPVPTVSFKAPASGTQISASSGLSNCEVTATDANGIEQVQFFMNGALYHTEKLAPYTCGFGGGKFPNGTYTLKAVATDKLGAKGQAQISLIIGSTTNTPPSVSLTAPSAGATLTKTASYAANATDNVAVAKVAFFLVQGSTKTLIGSKTTSPYSGTFDTTKYANGSYAVMAQATDNAGLIATTQRSVTISNLASDPISTPNPVGTSLTGASAVATFQSLGLYWKPGSAPSNGVCNIRYRKFSETSWREALPMWFDSRNSECRGSIVHLAPGTQYAVEVGTGGSFQAGVNTRTWSDSFPVAQTVQVQSGSQTLRITQGGSASGYVLYTGPATLDAANGQDYNIEISAPYVIIRGLTLKGARIHGIRLLPGARDVVIEGNDISGWGRSGVDRDSAISADCAAAGSTFLQRAVIQRNRLHHPRYSANSWDTGHPAGPQAVTFNSCGGNHVLRYNEVYSSDGGNYFNDGFSGGSNYSDIGFPNADSDIYGNKISHTWDDAIEAEGGNRNVRIWGNYLDQTATGIASTVTHHGPLYVFRNVYNRNRQRQVSLDESSSRSGYFKAGAGNGYGNGRRYMFHNTALQAVQSGLTYPLGIGNGLSGNTGQPLTNTVSRNNIYHVWRSSAVSIGQQSGSYGNDADYDLYNGALSSFPGAEPNGMVGTPTYLSGHGWSSWAGGNYQLQPGTQGHDQGVRLANFNDAFTGTKPDVGAHEYGTASMKFGVAQ